MIIVLIVTRVIPWLHQKNSFREKSQLPGATKYLQRLEFYFLTNKEPLQRNTGNPVCRFLKVYICLVWITTCLIRCLVKNTGPGWMHETSAQSWCSEKTWREQVGREVGGGIGMGKTCEPKAFSFQCMTKFTTNKKKKRKKENSFV